LGGQLIYYYKINNLADIKEELKVIDDTSKENIVTFCPLLWF